MHPRTDVTSTVTDGGRTPGARRFARVGRVLPVAFVQVIGTLLASGLPGGPAGRAVRGGPPWVVHAADAVHPGPLAIAFLVAGVVVLPWRWHRPRVVLVVTLATTIGYVLLVSPRGPFVAALTMAMANAWIRGHRWAVGTVAAIAVAAFPTADEVLGRSSARDLDAVFLALAWVTVTLAVAELVRVRLERVAERRRRRAAAEQLRARDERMRIARELHDSVAHSMSLINLQAGVALHLGDGLPDRTLQSLTDIRDTSRDALVELRTILGVLRSADGTGATPASDRAPVPGLDRLPDLVERARAAGLDLWADVDGDLAVLDGTTDRSAFRIVQESVTNVMKHAPDHRTEVRVRTGPDLVDLVVEDHPVAGRSGPAVAPTLGASGNGLIGMRERATAVGGSLTAGPTRSGGWRVTAQLPVRTPEHARSDPAAADARPMTDTTTETETETGATS